MYGQWIAFARYHPGCFSTATTQVACLAGLPAAVADYQAWLRRHHLAGSAPEFVPGDLGIGETQIGWCRPATEYEANAFFAADRAPLPGTEIERGLHLLMASRADLAAALSGLTPEQRDRTVEDGWSIATILKHIIDAEWWYLSRLDRAPPPEQLPDDLLEQLASVRAHLAAVLPTLADADHLAVRDYEVWSPRKVLRRAVWHERDHTAHLLRFRQLIAA
jgi:hypothetical protein